MIDDSVLIPPTSMEMPDQKDIEFMQMVNNMLPSDL